MSHNKKDTPLGFCLKCGEPIRKENIRQNFDGLSKEEVNEFRVKLKSRIDFMSVLDKTNVVKNEFVDGATRVIKFVDFWLGKMLGENNEEKEKTN